MESKPIEEVLFLRDEMANMAWGVERIVESAAEKPLNRFEQEIQTNRSAFPVCRSEQADLQTRDESAGQLGAAVAGKSDEGLRLRRGKVLKVDGPPEFLAAQGNILQRRSHE